MTLAAMRFLLLASLLLAVTLVAADRDWPVYGGDEGGAKYSDLKQITAQNVSAMQEAWTFRTGDFYQPKNSRATAFEATPLYVDGTLFLATPLGKVFALDPLTGKARWSYDAKVNRDAGYGDYATRGVSTWTDSQGGHRRIFLATIDARLIAVDATTGKLCNDFGDNGIVDLRHDLRIKPRGYADYEETSPPSIIGNTIVIGSGVADNGSVNQPSGEVRAYDVISGQKKWTWDPIPQDPHALGADTWKNGSAAKTGAANAWSIIVADKARGLVFVPTGSASPDYFGGERRGANLFADSVVALHADSGKIAWYFQTVHHNLWDYDVASPPVLFDLHRDGKTIAAIAVGSKTGNLFVLNRETGKPIFGVEERPVPKTDVPGEESSPTQPFPLLPHPLVPQQALTADQAWGIDDADRAACRAEIAKLRSDGIFTPPSIQGSLFVPGNIGGMAWGGAAFDPQHHLLIIPVNQFPAEARLIPRAQFSEEAKRGREIGGDWEFAAQVGTPYGMARRFLLSPKRLPCSAPPWSMLKAIDADTAELRWQVPLGEFPGLEKVPDAAKWGSVSLGGPIVTAGGVVFIASTLDPAIRAFDVTDGRELWKGVLPASARATPMTFLGPDGKQYVLISSGGHGVSSLPSADALVAFRLP